jgi:hypothetical protein
MFKTELQKQIADIFCFDSEELNGKNILSVLRDINRDEVVVYYGYLNFGDDETF